MSATPGNERTVAASLRAMLAGLIDYAGLFPPASLEMSAAVANYARYLAGEHSEMLGRFLLPASRLGEFESVANSLAGGTVWHLSALVAEPVRDMPAIAEFNHRNASRFIVDAAELKASAAGEILHARVLIHQSITPYFEIGPAMATELVPMILRVNGRAKIRTGGIIESAFPTSEAVADFILGCTRYEVAFKATAGLHHPVRCLKPLSYAPDAPIGTMHGFLNVFVAAVFSSMGIGRQQLVEILACEHAGDFEFTDQGMKWHDASAGVEDISAARRGFAISFGSCSFEEPVADLRGLDLL
jgi:hypothetical protein